MNNKIIQNLFDELKKIPVVLIPIAFIVILLFISFGFANSDTYIDPVGNDDSYLQSFADEIEATIINDDEEEVTLTLEVAKTQREIEEGLMNRTFLDYNRGMLFAYRGEQNLTFWMKDTYIPLDIIFIDSNKTIINIIENAEPLDESTDKYKSAAPAQFVIEVNGGWSDDNNVRAGNQVFF